MRSEASLGSVLEGMTSLCCCGGGGRGWGVQAVSRTLCTQEPGPGAREDPF